MLASDDDRGFVGGLRRFLLRDSRDTGQSSCVWKVTLHEASLSSD